MNLQFPSDLLADQIRDLYSVESQVVLAMPALAAMTSNQDLRELLMRQEQNC